MSYIRHRATQIRELTSAIYGLTNVLDSNDCQEIIEGGQPILGRFERGAINTAIKHLAGSAESLAEEIEGEATND